MGISTNAYLVVGLSFDDEGGPDEFERKLIEHFGLPERHPKYDTETDLSDIEEGPLKKLGLEIVSHCHCDVPMYVIGVACATAYRGHPVKIDKLPSLTEKQRKELKQINKLFDNEGEFGAWLCSYSEH